MIQVNLEQLVPPDPRVQLVALELLDLREAKESPVQRERLVTTVRVEPRDRLVLLAPSVPRER